MYTQYSPIRQIEDNKIKQIQYRKFFFFSSKQLTRLNLSVCVCACFWYERFEWAIIDDGVHDYICYRNLHHDDIHFDHVDYENDDDVFSVIHEANPIDFDDVI